MAITAAMVKELFKATGAGMLDCKKALTDANGDMAEAEKILKEKGLAAVAKRSERATSEGRIYIKQEGNKVAIVEVTCETDFVAKNAEFIATGEKVLAEVLAKGYTEANDELKNMVLDFATRTRENMSLSTVKLVTVPENAVAGMYIHTDFKQAAVVVIKGSTDDKVKEFARDCCMHLVAETPSYNTRAEVPAEYVEEQKSIFKAQMDQDEKMASKPEKVKEGILQGKINKHLAEICFEDQMFVKDDKKTVKAKLEEVGKSVGASLAFGEIHLLLLGK
ncbi:MAG: translation elongation factor Ts [Treponema sp.]|nr:translation elongation factor Ts [Spirochaetales bacterium]MDY5810955.1 translation elongation factor Ts [Treponema sp.]MEE1182268.1 translation elongation factor Ts [Treponema sp.]